MPPQIQPDPTARLEAYTRAAFLEFCSAATAKQLTPYFILSVMSVSGQSGADAPKSAILYVRVKPGYSRSYSTLAIHPTYEDAENAAVKTAAEQGVEKFVHANASIAIPYHPWPGDGPGSVPYKLKDHVNVLASLKPQGVAWPTREQLEMPDTTLINLMEERNARWDMMGFQNFNNIREFRSLPAVEPSDM